ncbi:MAG TPA: abortive infection system antitoxin AbiGi family protein, partial [Bacteroidia bacterium]|nr:abortive infection system antitoxin AbiGi family protein [Bacteroidia bacterium]
MDINLSANTLFHFTENRQSLLGILKNGIYIRYSLENYEGLVDEGDDKEVVLPMACFCDIPLSQVKRHIKIYGRYAIGLTKKWGMKNKINPVIYTYNNSSIANILDEIHKDIESFIDIEEDTKDMVVNTTPDDAKKSEEMPDISLDGFDESEKFLSKISEVM